MKHLLLTFIALQLFTNSFGQKTEFNISLNSGLFSFIGKSVVGTTFLYTYTGYHNLTQTFIGNPFGSKNGLCYGFSLNLKRVTARNFIFGLDVGYEVLRSKVSISEEYEHTFVDSTITVTPNYTSIKYNYNIVTRNITGKAFTNNSFINFYPFLGYRYKYKKINFDLTAGMDIGYYLKIKESGCAKKPDGTNYNITMQNFNTEIDSDFRPRFQLSSSYRKFGLYFGYAYGISDYYTKIYDPQGMLGLLTNKVYRFGVTYQLK
jgi:hypothetical protein